MEAITKRNQFDKKQNEQFDEKLLELSKRRKELEILNKLYEDETIIKKERRKERKKNLLEELEKKIEDNEEREHMFRLGGIFRKQSERYNKELEEESRFLTERIKTMKKILALKTNQEVNVNDDKTAMEEKSRAMNQSNHITTQIMATLNVCLIKLFGIIKFPFFFIWNLFYKKISSKSLLEQCNALKNREMVYNELDPDEKSRINKAKVNYQGRIITFEQFACNSEEIYAALSHSEIITLLEGKELCIGEEIKPKAKNLIERKFKRIRCKEKDDYFDSDEDDDKNKRNGKEVFGKKEERCQQRSNGTNSGGEGTSFNGGGGKSNENNDTDDNEEFFDCEDENGSFNEGGEGSNDRDGDGDDDDERKKYKNISESLDSDGSEILCLDELLLEAKRQKIISIIDISGAGCTTALETIGDKILNEWESMPHVSFVSMNTQWYLRSDIFHEVECCSPEKLLEITIELIKIFNNIKKLEETKLRIEFQKGNVVFLWDGIDKIPKKAFKGFLTFLKRVKDSNNIQFLTANQYIREIETVLEVKSFQMVPFSNDDIRLFVKKYAEHFNTGLDKKGSLLNVALIYKSTIATPQLLEALVEVFSKGNVDDSNIYDVFKKLITNLSTKKRETDIFKIPISLAAHQAVAIQTIFSESFKDVTNSEESVKIKQMLIFNYHPANSDYCHEQSKLYKFFYKEKNHFYFHHKFIACFFVAHYILTNVLFPAPEIQPSDMIIRHKLLFFIAIENFDDRTFIKALILHGIKLFKSKEKGSNPYNYQTIKNNFPCIFEYFEFSTSAINFLSDCFKHDGQILSHFWNNGKRNGFIFKASQKPGWNMKEIRSIALKYFEQNELLAFEENPSFNIGFKINH